MAAPEPGGGERGTTISPATWELSARPCNGLQGSCGGRRGSGEEEGEHTASLGTEHPDPEVPIGSDVTNEPEAPELVS